MKTLYFNGTVYTGELPMVTAFSVEDGRFLMVGTDMEILESKKPGDAVVDLGGRFVCAGFNDSHMHLLNYGQFLSSAQLSEHTGNLKDMTEYLKKFIADKKIQPGKWVKGRGWNQDYFKDTSRMPDRWDLDKVSSENPLCMVRACGHCLVVNSKAIDMMGITAKTPDPKGGRIGRENGVPDGRFYDNAMDMVFDAIPQPTEEELADMLKTAAKSLNSKGITSCQSDDYCVFRKIPWRNIDAVYEKLIKSGEMPLRVCQQGNFVDMDGLEDYLNSGNVTGKGDEMYKKGPVKIMIDGALGARTAYMTEPYHDDPSARGIAVISQEVLDEMICFANAHNTQAAVHAIGDGAVDMALHSYRKALSENPREDHRHGIVHCQITRPDQLKSMAEMNLHIYAQSIFLDYDIRIVKSRVSQELASSSYSWKTLMSMGVTVSNGTDCPVENPDVLPCIQCAVTRSTISGEDGPYLPNEAFTVQEALDSYTVKGAEASFSEKIKGKIKIGMLADFVILDSNPFDCKPENIKDINVLATYLEGRAVFTV